LLQVSKHGLCVLSHNEGVLIEILNSKTFDKNGYYFKVLTNIVPCKVSDQLMVYSFEIFIFVFLVLLIRFSQTPKVVEFHAIKN